MMYYTNLERTERRRHNLLFGNIPRAKSIGIAKEYSLTLAGFTAWEVLMQKHSKGP